MFANDEKIDYQTRSNQRSLKAVIIDAEVNWNRQDHVSHNPNGKSTKNEELLNYIKLLESKLIESEQRYKLVEELHIESEKKLKEFAQAVPDVSFIFDEDGRVIEAFGNERLFVRPEGELQGLTLYQVFPGEDANAILSVIRQAIVSGMSQYEFRHQIWFRRN